MRITMHGEHSKHIVLGNGKGVFHIRGLSGGQAGRVKRKFQPIVG
jgi:hypothetical protein